MESKFLHVTLEKHVRYEFIGDAETSVRLLAFSGFEESSDDASFRRFRLVNVYPHRDDAAEWLASHRSGQAVPVELDEETGAMLPRDAIPRIDVRRDNILSVTHALDGTDE